MGRGARALGGGGPLAAGVRSAPVGGDRQGPRASPARSRGGAGGRGGGPRARPAAPRPRPPPARVPRAPGPPRPRTPAGREREQRSAAALTPKANSTAPLAPPSPARQ